MKSSRLVYHINVAPEQTRKTSAAVHAYISIILPKKRSQKSNNTYWYCDPSFLILRRHRCHQDHESKTVDDDTSNTTTNPWICERCVISGVKRENHCEIMLQPEYMYCCVPFSYVVNNRRSCHRHDENSGGGTQQQHYPFRMTLYCNSAHVNVNETVNDDDNNSTGHIVSLTLLHKELLMREPKLIYRITENCLLVCMYSPGCVSFVAVNGHHDHYVSIKLMIDTKQDDNNDVLFVKNMNAVQNEFPGMLSFENWIKNNFT